MVVICARTTGWMDEVGEAVDVTYFGFSMAFDIVSRMGQSGVVLPEWMDHNLAEKKLGHEAGRIIMVNN